jgi:putative redox protein
MDVKVNWQGRMSFTGSADSGFSMKLDADPSVGGDNDGFRPMELMALSLAGCTAMDVISILQKKREDVTGFEVKVHAERAGEHPKVMTSAVIDYLVSGRNVSEAAVVRAIELSARRYCPAQAMLGKLMPLELRYTIYEDLGGGEQRQAISGVYVVEN